MTDTLDKPSSFEIQKHVPGYTIVAVAEDYCVYYWLYGVVATGIHGEPVLWDTADCQGTDKLEDAVYDLCGFVKWDGCSQWYAGSNIPIHLCGKSYIVEFCDALQIAYDWTAELCKHWSEQND